MEWLTDEQQRIWRDYLAMTSKLYTAMHRQLQQDCELSLSDYDVLVALSERGLAAGVLPYYLHQLDRVAGAAHFEVDDARALALHAALRDHLPGYLVPRLVREVAGDGSKRPL